MDEDKNIEKKKHLTVLISESSAIASEDDEYIKNMKSVRPKLKTLDDCIMFYTNWLHTYRQVKRYWEKGDEY